MDHSLQADRGTPKGLWIREEAGDERQQAMATAPASQVEALKTDPLTTERNLLYLGCLRCRDRGPSRNRSAGDWFAGTSISGCPHFSYSGKTGLNVFVVPQKVIPAQVAYPGAGRLSISRIPLASLYVSPPSPKRSDHFGPRATKGNQQNSLVAVRLRGKKEP